MPAQHAAAAPTARGIALRDLAEAVQQIAVLAGDEPDGDSSAQRAPPEERTPRGPLALADRLDQAHERAALVVVEEHVGIGPATRYSIVATPAGISAWHGGVCGSTTSVSPIPGQAIKPSSGKQAAQHRHVLVLVLELVVGLLATAAARPAGRGRSSRQAASEPIPAGMHVASPAWNWPSGPRLT